MVGEGHGCLKAQEAVPAFEAAFDGAADVAGMSALSLVIISGRLRTPAGREGGDAVAAGLEGVAGHHLAMAGGEQHVGGLADNCHGRLSSGVQRSFRPLPGHLTGAPASSRMSAQVRLVSSETRRPVRRPVRIIAWSRWPVQVVRSQVASRASASASVSQLMSERVVVHPSMARTRWIVAASSGACSAA